MPLYEESTDPISEMCVVLAHPPVCEAGFHPGGKPRASLETNLDLH